jgi:hypothetical protein
MQHRGARRALMAPEVDQKLHFVAIRGSGVPGGPEPQHASPVPSSRLRLPT